MKQQGSKNQQQQQQQQQSEDVGSRLHMTIGRDGKRYYGLTALDSFEASQKGCERSRVSVAPSLRD